MPAFASGVTIASASFPPVYQKDGIAYYNISDISKLPKEETESILKEYNNYTLQFLSIHEGLPVLRVEVKQHLSFVGSQARYRQATHYF